MQDERHNQATNDNNSEVVIQDVKTHHGHEVITIMNQGEGKQSLTGWSIATLDGLFVFKIPLGLTLMPEGCLSVACGTRRSILEEYDLIWKRYKGLNEDWDVIWLIDASGKVVDHCRYGRIGARGPH
jgi:hypothetical protein